MSRTKEEILKCALRLFNENGISQVSLRKISIEMGISLGNLTYHFKKREEIIDALYLNLVSNLNEVVNEKLGLKSQFQLLFEIPMATLSNFYEYRFLMLDFVLITRNHSTIGNHYRKLIKEREQQFEMLIKDLVVAKLLREELIDNEYKYLFKNLRIVSDFWLSSSSIDKNGKTSKKDVLEGSQLLENIIYPYLTLEGRSAFLEWKG
jgi:AcrR family transcriptional regulator